MIKKVVSMIESLDRILAVYFVYNGKVRTVSKSYKRRLVGVIISRTQRMEMTGQSALNGHRDRRCVMGKSRCRVFGQTVGFVAGTRL